MTDEELLSFTNSLEKKLGKENTAIIADDLGLLITKNSDAVKASQKKDAEINDLKKRNELLTASNGELLRRIPMAQEKAKNSFDKVTEDSDEEEKNQFNFKDAFDKYGNFKH